MINTNVFEEPLNIANLRVLSVKNKRKEIYILLLLPLRFEFRWRQIPQR
jgi:hypothetical protein